MGKSGVKQLREEVKERHEFRKRLKEEAERWYEMTFKEQLDELRSSGLRDDDQEQR